MKWIISNVFTEQIKHLRKRYPKIDIDIMEFQNRFNLIDMTALGKDLWKCRVGNKSIPTGKSGGFRIIVLIRKEHIIPICIYAKTDQDNIDIAVLKRYLKDIIAEIG